MNETITNEGEIFVQGEYLRQRLDWAQKINSTFLWMQRKDLWGLFRPNQKYGGVMFHREIDYEEGPEKPKRIGYVLTPDGEVILEQLDRYNETTGKFESVITGEFSPMMLTARSGPNPRAPLLWWLPPSKGNKDIDREEEMQTLLNMVHVSDQEAKRAKAEYHNALRELNSLRRRLREEERTNEELRNRLDALQPEITALRHRMEAQRIERIKDEETLKEVLKRAEQDGKYRGKHGIEFAQAIMKDIFNLYNRLEEIKVGESPQGQG